MPMDDKCSFLVDLLRGAANKNLDDVADFLAQARKNVEGTFDDEQVRIIHVLEQSSKMVLVPDNINEPFAPLWRGRDGAPRAARAERSGRGSVRHCQHRRQSQIGVASPLVTMSPLIGCLQLGSRRPGTERF